MSRAYYNEIDPYAAQWLRNLISAGHIAPGDVDERSIKDVRADELIGYTQCHFFAGIGVWSYALRRAGWPDDRPVWTGSCPCQPFSAAGKQKGFDDDRHLWPVWFDLIRERRPSDILGEQVASAPALAWCDAVSTDLEQEGYAFGAAIIPAASVGAFHIRDRLWWVAHAERHQQRREESCRGEARRMGWQQQSVPWDRDWQTALAEFRVLDDGITRSVATTDAYRNALVAPLAEQFIGAVLDIMP